MPKLGKGDEPAQSYPKGWNDLEAVDAANPLEAMRNAVIVAVAAVAVTGLGLLLYSSAYSPAHIAAGTASGEALLRTVLFSGAPYMVLCSKHDVKEALAKSPQHEVFAETADIVYEHHVRAAVVDCNAPFPDTLGPNADPATGGPLVGTGSGDTLRKRFGLIKAKHHPLAFVVANGNKPYQVPVNIFNDSGGFAKFVRSHERPKKIEPTNGGALVKHCLADGARPCLVAHCDRPWKRLQKPERQALFAVARANRLARLMYVDTKNYAFDVGTPALTNVGQSNLLRATVLRRWPHAKPMPGDAPELTLVSPAAAEERGQAAARRFGGVRGGAAIGADGGADLKTWMAESRAESFEVKTEEEEAKAAAGGEASGEESTGWSALVTLPSLKWVATASKKGGAVEQDPNMSSKEQRKAERERRQREMRKQQAELEASMSDEAKAAQTEKREKKAAARMEEQMKQNHAQAVPEGADEESAPEEAEDGDEAEETIDLDDE